MRSRRFELRIQICLTTRRLYFAALKAISGQRLPFQRAGIMASARTESTDLKTAKRRKRYSICLPCSCLRFAEKGKQGVTAAEYRCERADNLWLHTQIIQTIVSLISQSQMIIADCSKKNANVFYEAGIAHAIGKDVILIAQSIDDIPFDLRHHAIIQYYPTPDGLADLSIKLTARIKQVATGSRRA